MRRRCEEAWPQAASSHTVSCILGAPAGEPRACTKQLAQSEAQHGLSTVSSAGVARPKARAFTPVLAASEKLLLNPAIRMQASMQLGYVVTNARALERGIPGSLRAPQQRAQPPRVGASPHQSCIRRQQHRLCAQPEGSEYEQARDPEAELVTEAPSTSAPNDQAGQAAHQQSLSLASASTKRAYHWSPGMLLAAAPLLGFAGSLDGAQLACALLSSCSSLAAA